MMLRCVASLPTVLQEAFLTLHLCRQSPLCPLEHLYLNAQHQSLAIIQISKRLLALRGSVLLNVTALVKSLKDATTTILPPISQLPSRRRLIEHLLLKSRI